MTIYVQDGIAQTRIIADPERGQDRAVRKGTDQTLALERDPHGTIAQPCGVIRCDDCLADVKMVAVRHGEADDNDASGLITRPGLVGKTGQLLQQGQRSELQRVEIERVLLRGHSD